MLQNQHHPPSTNNPKWVTFNDMVDDAMEGGKLLRNNYNLNRRRASMMDTPTASSSEGKGRHILTGSCSTQDFTALKSGRPWNSVMLSSSSTDDSGFGGNSTSSATNQEFRTAATTEMQNQTELATSRNSSNPFYAPSSNANPENCNNSDLQRAPVLPKPPETHGRTRPRPPRLSAFARHSVSSMSTSGTIDDEEDDDDRGSVGSGGDPPHRPFSQSFGGIGEKDKYSAFTGLKKPGQGYTGWSTQVMGTGPFGWSDELLNGGGGDSTAPAACQEHSQPELSKEDEEAPWYKGHRTSTWNTSPSRSFLRNFP